MDYIYNDYRTSADYIASKLPSIPDVAIVLGSGLGGTVDNLENALRIPYSEIPNFPRSTVENHKGELVYAVINGHAVLFMNGRFHYYEGYDMRTTAFHVGVFYLLGIKKLILTNAAGAINDSYVPGDLVCVTDHIKLAPDSPVRGANIPEFGTRFFDMQSVYSSKMREIAMSAAQAIGFTLREGVYAYMSGPQYETPAEIRALKVLGADLVGMSTAAEVIQAAQCHMEVLCISCVSNYAAGVSGGGTITHEEVCEIGLMVAERFKSLLYGVIDKI